MFDELHIKRCYRSKIDNIENDFIIPLLKESICYDRGTGFFSLHVLSELSKGLIPYIKRNGIIRIITSVELDFEDVKIISNAIENAKQRITESLFQAVKEKLDEKETLNLDLISNLIATNQLQIRIAYLPEGGIYHEKIGYLEDDDGNCIWFAGSQNETHSGYNLNAESLLVMKSWAGDLEEIKEQQTYFNALWNNQDPNIRTFDIPEAIKLCILQKYKKSETLSKAIEQITRIEEANATNIKNLYPYQKDAINEFIQNDYNHFFEMATGTGKTFTAVKAIEKMVELCVCDKLFVIVIVPQIDLQIQWKNEFEKNNMAPFLLGGEAISNWKSILDKAFINYYSGTNLTICICVYDTYFQKIASVLESHKINKMIVADEAHEISNNQMAKMSASYQYRLGLSATPERHDRNETDTIVSYFTRGRIEPYIYTIDEAIKNHFLAHYQYHPIIVNLDEEEFELYHNYTKQLMVLCNQEEPDKDRIQEVSNNRSIIVKKAKNKLVLLKKMVESGNYNFSNAVVYCGQGKEKDKTNDEKIIDTVTKTLSTSGGLKVSQFASWTIDRTRVLEEFEKGYYDTLVAIKCFDQGVDVPKLDKIYILASDSLMRQTIQRRGRVLRKCKETGKNIAHIYDMISLPPEIYTEGIGVKSLVGKEIKRAKEYARLSDNLAENVQFISAILNKYGMTGDCDDEKENY